MVNFHKKHINDFILYLGMIFSFSVISMSCSEKPLYQQHVNLPDQTWNYDNNIVFQPEILDTSINYDIFLNLKYSKDFPFQNIYFSHKLTDPSHNIKTDTLLINLISGAGLWQGKCNKHECDLSAPLASNARFSVPGTYSVEIGQLTRVDSLSGLLEIGLLISQSPSK